MPFNFKIFLRKQQSNHLKYKMEIENKRSGEKRKSELNPSSKQHDISHQASAEGSGVSQRTENHSQRLNTETSFTDNLIELYEGCRDEMFELKKQNKMQKQEISKLKIEASKWKTIAECYITSWDSVQPEFKSLRAQVDEAETREDKMMEAFELREKERENERMNMENRLEEREKEVCEQRSKMELMEKERQEMEMKLNQLQTMKIELETVSENHVGRLMSKTKGQCNIPEVKPKDSKGKDHHLPRLAAGSSNEPTSQQKFRRALKSKILPNSVTQKSSIMFLLPSPPKSSELVKLTSRPCKRNLIPLQLI